MCQYEVGALAHMKGSPFNPDASSEWQYGWEEQDAQDQQKPGPDRWKHLEGLPMNERYRR